MLPENDEVLTDCYYSKMHTFRHFLFLNSRRKSGDSNFCNTLKFMRSWKFSNRDIYSVAYSLQISNRNTNNSRGTDFLRAWLHSSGRRFRADMNNGSINGTSGSSSYGSGDANGNGQGLYSSMKKKPGKCKTYCVCSQCGEWHGQWWGICLTSKTVNSLQDLHDKESRPVVSSGAVAGFRVAESRVGRFNPDSEVRDQHKASQPRSVNSGKVDDLKSQRLSDVTRGLSKQQWRIPMTGPFGIEVGRVVGGGLVPDLQVLNEYRQVQRFSAVNSVYNGIFGIHATAGISTSRERHVEASSETNIEPVPSPLSQIPALSSGKTKEKSSVQRKRTVQAVLKKIKQSPKKVNLVAALVRGMRVEDALLQMQVTVKRAAKTVYKVIHSARANAVHNHGLDGDRLIIDQAFVGKGLFRKTISYHAKGRSGIRVRPQCRLTVIVRELKPKEEAEIAKLRVRKFKKLSKREHRLVPHKLVETQWRWHRKPKDQAASGSTMA